MKMKLEYLNDRIKDYKNSIETVVQKKIYWKEHARIVLLNTLKAIASKYAIGWTVQELNWIQSNEAINISFDSFPPELLDQTNKIPSYQFIQGAALVFTQTYNGDVLVIILFPLVDNTTPENSSLELGNYNPKDINEKLVIEKVDEFLKEIIQWEIPNKRNKLGFQNQS
ncbi:MAG TPA: hypothetical protein VN192_01985 [Flavobacterium sp.]|jgi:hypothetical protein|nr:hypothetical protein [Flavobacterium sp.]